MDTGLAPGKNEARLIELDGQLVVLIQLQGGRICLVDLADWDLLRRYRWHWKWESRTETGERRLYVATSIWEREERRHRAIRIHRLITAAPEQMMVDHRSGDTLDNRRSNLRIADNSRNQANSGSRGGSSRYKGVSWNARKRRWLVAFRANGQYHFVGYFRDEFEAAKAYDAAAEKVSGEFARTNFIVTRAVSIASVHASSSGGQISANSAA